MRALGLVALGPLALLAFAATAHGSGSPAKRILHRVDSGTQFGQYRKYHHSNNCADVERR